MLFAALRFVFPGFLDEPHPSKHLLFFLYICVRVLLSYVCLPQHMLSESCFESLYARYRCFLDLFHYFTHPCGTRI